MQNHIVNPTIETVINTAKLNDTIECNFKTYTIVEVGRFIRIERILHNRKIELMLEKCSEDYSSDYVVDLTIIDKEDSVTVNNCFKKELRIAQVIHFLGYRGIKLMNEVFCPT